MKSIYMCMEEEEGEAVRERESGKSIKKRNSIFKENGGNVSSVGIPSSSSNCGKGSLSVQIPHRGVD